MAIKLGKYSFTGPVKSIDKIKNRSGVYAIVCFLDNEYFLTDVGEGSKLRTSIETYDKQDCWTEHCKGQLMIFVHYTPFISKEKRIYMVQELSELFHPDCAIAEIDVLDF